MKSTVYFKVLDLTCSIELCMFRPLCLSLTCSILISRVGHWGPVDMTDCLALTLDERHNLKWLLECCWKLLLQNLLTPFKSSWRLIKSNCLIMLSGVCNCVSCLKLLLLMFYCFFSLFPVLLVLSLTVLTSGKHSVNSPCKSYYTK